MRTPLLLALLVGCIQLQAQPAICDELQAGFTYTTTPNGTQFSNSTTGTGEQTTWYWTFGDGETSTDAQPSHAYTNPGAYEACLYAITIYFNGGSSPTTCVDTACVMIEIGGGNPCSELGACFIASQTSANTVFFNNCTQPGTNTQYLWSFGDGGSGSSVSPTHIYDQPGTYTVCVTAYWNNCVDEFCTTVVVESGTDPCDGFSADFWFGTNGGDPTSIFYSATTGTGPHWLWSFGDGTYSDNGPQGTHTYAAPGAYTLCLTVWDWIPGTQDTCSVTTCQPVVIEGANPCDDLVACFEAVAVDNDSFVFQNCTQPGTNIQYVWHFGDGTTSSEINPDHTFVEAGTYTVCLTAYWNNCVDEFCSTVVVEGGTDPCSGLIAGFIFTTTPNGTYFSNTTTGTGFQTTWHWDFGDGTTSDGAQVVHIFPGGGTYEVCLTVISMYETPGGVITCTDEFCAEVLVGGDPCADLNACFEVLAIDIDSYVFTNCTSPATNVQYEWHFGDGTVSTGPNPEHTYLEPGTYTICLAVYWENCVDEFCETIVVQGGNNPCEDLSALFTPVVTGALVNFQNAATSPLVTYIWNFGDGATGYGPDPVHTYSEPGTYEACLLAWAWNPLTQDTCFADNCELVIIEAGTSPCDELVAGFLSTTTPNGTYFSNTTTGVGFQTTWHWDFGDGTTSDGAQVVHIFPGPGTYEVCLTAISMFETPGGVVTCSDEFCAAVVIGGGPCDDLEACFATTAIDNNSFYFVNCTTPAAGVQYVWSFGDGASSTGLNADHSYQEPGTYLVCLTAYWENCVDSTCATVVVEEAGGCTPFQVDFGYSVQNNAVVFEATASVPVVGYLWYFGDGGEGYGQVVTHLYEPPGPFNVCLVAWYWNNNTQDTCWAEHCEWVDPFEVGVEEQNMSAVRIFPMPAHGGFTVEGLVSPCDVRLYSTEGRMVLQQRATGARHTVDIGSLAPAIYSLELRYSDRSTWRRVAIE